MTKSCQESIDVMSGSNWCFVCWSQWLCITRSLAVSIYQSTTVSHSKRVYWTVWLETIPPLWHNWYPIVDWLHDYLAVGSTLASLEPNLTSQPYPYKTDDSNGVFVASVIIWTSLSVFPTLSNTFNPLDPLDPLDPCIKSEHLKHLP